MYQAELEALEKEIAMSQLVLDAFKAELDLVDAGLSVTDED